MNGFGLLTPEQAWLLGVRPQDVTCRCEDRKEFLNHLQIQCNNFFGW